MPKYSRLLLGVPACFTLLVAWFAWSTLHAAPQIATENLRGAGLSAAAAIEQLAFADPSLRSLARYTTPDIAYFALLDQSGVIEFHTNRRLIGERFPAAPPADSSGVAETREQLGTGEVVYILNTRVHFSHDERRLVLALHTYRADQVIRRAKTGVTVVAALTAVLWPLTLLLLFLLRRDEQRRQEMNRREELARLGEMGAVMAHEIRNPLAGIKGFAQLVEMSSDLEQARRHAGKIVTQSLRMEALVNDLLAFARDDQGGREATDLSVLVQDCADLLRPEAAALNVAIEVTAPDGLSIRTAADRIEQLLINLMKNALQAMPEGGRLSVGLQKQARSLAITVRDTGCGIPQEHLPKIFEPFWTSKARGTGLGLALCRKIAEEHGGSLTVSSTVGSGTGFTLTLPLTI